MVKTEKYQKLQFLSNFDIRILYTHWIDYRELESTIKNYF